LEHLIDFENFLKAPTDLHLYNVFLKQLEKDFLRAGIDFEIHAEEAPNLLKERLQFLIDNFLSTAENRLVTLFYIIDIPENFLKECLSGDIPNPAEAITFLLLKREWQKVVMRRKYSQK